MQQFTNMRSHTCNISLTQEFGKMQILKHHPALVRQSRGGGDGGARQSASPALQVSLSFAPIWEAPL